jgi:hypothetical protein
MTASTDNLLAIAADLNAAGKEVTITRLPARKPRKGETWMRPSQSGRSGSVQTVRPGDGDETRAARGRGQGSGDRCIGGRGVTLNPVGGIGAQMVADLDATIAAAAAQYAADRRAAARERLMDRIDDALAI